MNTINIGLSKTEIQEVVKLLNQNLADFYLLQIKTKKYHWDVVGPQFLTLHEIWQGQYEIISDNIDNCAERIRALGEYPIGTAQLFLENTTLKEHPSDLPNSTEMVQRLVINHEHIIRNLRRHIDLCSQKFHDEGTADFLTGIMEQHEEMAWMLRSFIGGKNIEPRIREERELITES
ncbi:Dps family protein [Cyanobacterium sp. Dongsha4]|uniref:Dps family protein n=1 Tax=Cyanobacterium sp. DS4 TaxID=2878255 RepID=UPI002E800DF5|nr:Dps family protein [Cyanobacterium sp. Dongsha4]WVL01550.1 DNA starvation/stationary phase protection protein [Cyanobacterium sp. Dongsha4]